MVMHTWFWLPVGSVIPFVQYCKGLDVSVEVIDTVRNMSTEQRVVVKYTEKGEFEFDKAALIAIKCAHLHGSVDCFR
jgi:hypothetical protein